MFARALSLATVLALFPACVASSPAPEAWRLSMDDVQRIAFGAWTRVQAKGLVVDGELLAANENMLVLARGAHVTLVPSACIETVTVAAFEGTAGEMIAWGTLGSLSTLSHGYFLIFSLPIWLATMGGSTYAQSGAGYLGADFRETRAPETEKVRKSPQFLQGPPPGYVGGSTYSQSGAGDSAADFRKARAAETERVRKWARFPQGLPPGYLEQAASVLPAQCGAPSGRGQAAPPKPATALGGPH